MHHILESLVQENITKIQLNALEKKLDELFAKVGADIEFSKHFLERLNDSRNGDPITLKELATMLSQFYARYKNAVPKFEEDFQGLIKDMTSDINLPFSVDRHGDEVVIISKTIMRKKSFKSSSKEFRVD